MKKSEPHAWETIRICFALASTVGIVMAHESRGVDALLDMFLAGFSFAGVFWITIAIIPMRKQADQMDVVLRQLTEAYKDWLEGPKSP